MTNFKVKNEVLVKAVNKIFSVVATGIRITIVGSKKVPNKGTMACIEAYDEKSVEIQTHFFIDTDCTDTVTCKVNGKEFSSIVRALGKLAKDFDLTISDSDLSISVGESANIKLPVLSECKLIERPVEKPFCSIKVSTEDWLNALKKGAYAYGGKGPGIYFNVNEEGIELYSLDGTRAAKSYVKGQVETSKELKECNFYVGPEINNIKAILGSDVTGIYILDKCVLVQNGTDVAIISKINSTFPVDIITNLYKSRAIESTIELNQKDLLNGIEITTVIDDAKQMPLLLKIDQNKLYLLSSKGNAKIQLNATITGNFDFIAFNAELLRKAVEASGESIVLQYVNPQQPLWIEEKENKDTYAFICPVNPKTDQ